MNISHEHKRSVFPINSINQVLPLDLGIIHSFKYYHRKQGIPNAVTVTDDRLLQDAAHTMLDVLSAMHFTAADWKLVTPNSTIKNCFEKCCNPSDHVGSNNNALTTDWW